MRVFQLPPRISKSWLRTFVARLGLEPLQLSFSRPAHSGFPFARLFGVLASAVILLSAFDANAQSTVPGQCWPAYGDPPRDVTASINQILSVRPEDNVPGKTFINVFSWDLPSRSVVTCYSDVKDGYGLTSPNYYTTLISSSPAGTDGGLTWYKLNENFSYSVSFWIHGNVQQYQNAPFERFSNQLEYPPWFPKNHLITIGNIETGAKGRLSLRLDKPFIGHSPVNHSLLAQIAMTLQDEEPAAPAPPAFPFINVNLTGEIIIPPSCGFTVGNATIVDLGSYPANTFVTVGAVPAGRHPKPLNVDWRCSNLPVGSKLYVSMSGDVAAQIPYALKSTNPLIGVIVNDASNQPVMPNRPVLAADPTTASDQFGTLHWSVYPTRLASGAIELGPFSAVATLTMDVQ
jgi:minor fimbrial subunit